MSYHFACICGFPINTAYPFGKCSCGKDWRLEWPADAPRTSGPPKTISDTIEAKP